MNQTSLSTLMLSFFAGGIAGAGIALLLAPQSGQETRDMMVRKLHEADSSARGLKDRLVRRGEEIKVEASRRVGAAASALSGNGGAEANA